MKKRLLALLLCAVTAASMIGCGNKSNTDGSEAVENTESTETAKAPAVNLAQYNFNGVDQVELCDYSAIPVTLDVNYEVSDQDVQDYAEYIFSSNGPFYVADESKTTVEEGDIVNVDYVGKLDGEAFSGGSATDQNIDVSNNSSPSGSSYIDGFTDGLLGANVGDVIDANVTFPDEYPNNPDLAGKEVVFTFTVNSIQKEISIDEMDDDFVSEQFGVNSVDDFYSQVRLIVENQRKNSLYTAIEDYLLDNCTVDVPQEYQDAMVEAIKARFVENYCGGDASQIETVLSNYGHTLDEMEETWSENAKNSIQLELIVKAIAAKENITVDEVGFQSYVNNVVNNNGLSDEAAAYDLYGYGDSTYGENQMRVIYTANLVLDKLAETAVISVNTDSTETVESTEAVESTEE